MGARVVAILTASLCFSTVLGASNATTAHKAGKTSGSIFDDRNPRKSPKECYFTVSPSGQGQVITVATDQPFRASSGEDVSIGDIRAYTAITFRVPAGFPGASGREAAPDAQGYVVTQVDEKAKKGEPAGLTKLVVDYEGEKDVILKDSAEVVLAPELVPVRVKVSSVTKAATFNRISKLTCEEFTEIKIETPEVEQAAGKPQEIFWQSLRELCGKAFAHIQDPPVASTPILDVRTCTDDTVLFGVHYLTAGEEKSWNRGQTWLISKMADGLRMKYSRRESPEPTAKQTGWSAGTADEGTPELQVFLPDAATRESIPALKNFGWVIKIERGDPGHATFVYQAVEKTDAGQQSRGGYAFDLSSPIEPPSEPPWGLTTGPSVPPPS